MYTVKQLGTGVNDWFDGTGKPEQDVNGRKATRLLQNPYGMACFFTEKILIQLASALKLPC